MQTQLEHITLYQQVEGSRSLLFWERKEVKKLGTLWLRGRCPCNPRTVLREVTSSFASFFPKKEDFLRLQLSNKRRRI